MTRLGKMFSLFWNPKPIGPPWEQLIKRTFGSTWLRVEDS